MEQQRKQISMDELFAAIGDLYLQLRFAQKEVVRLVEINEKLVSEVKDYMDKEHKPK